jgi:site-specific DNA-methyltransferase (adenine-specific)
VIIVPARDVQDWLQREKGLEGMKPRAPRNRTLTCFQQEIQEFSAELMSLRSGASVDQIAGRIINGDVFDVAVYLPHRFVDLLILDPPYNLSKDYNGQLFKEKEKEDYRKWFSSVVDLVKPLLKPSSTAYVCSDWRTSGLVLPILEEHFFVRNRITWEREKGRGARSNWKNNAEDIWFCTPGQHYFFNVDAVKLRRRVIAPYRTEDGKTKDWHDGSDGSFRITHPSNIWTDITVPFWSMPENTDHPTQKPEKLIAKLILASSKRNDFVFDPFLGSGTSAVVAKKLGRRFSGVELDREYCCLALKRLKIAEGDPSIQGYADGVFWERNSLQQQPRSRTAPSAQRDMLI